MRRNGAKALIRIWKRELPKFRRALLSFPAVRLEVEVTPKGIPARRMAYTVMGTRPARVVFYARALDLPDANLTGLVRHELGHIVASFGGRDVDIEGVERSADLAAEYITGQFIRYDRRGIQTTGAGRWPRPRGLR